MKRLTIFLILVVSVLNACNSQHAIRRINFIKSSRGTREEVAITKDSVFVIIGISDSIKDSSATLDEKKWSRLNASVKSLSLSEIPLYKSPTMKRTFDGALHGTLSITTDDGKTYTHGFDDENPHPKLHPLMKCIQEIRDPLTSKF